MSSTQPSRLVAWHQRLVDRFMPALAEHGSERGQRAAFLVQIELLVVAVLLGRMALLQVVDPHVPSRQDWILMALVALYAGGLWLVKAGRLEAAARLVLGLGWIGMTVSAFLGSGIYDNALAGYVLTIMVAGLLCRWQEVIALLLASLTVIAAMLLLQAHGSVVATPETFSDMARDHTTILLLAAGLVLIYVRSLSDQTRRFDSELRERLRAEQELRESEASLRTIVAAIPDAIFICDDNGHYLAVNDAACRQLGYTREELLNIGILDVVAPEYIPRAKARIADPSLYADQFVQSLHRRRDGSMVATEVGTVAIAYRGRQCLLVVARDLSQRLEAETALRESERRFRLLAENASDVICVMEPDGEVLFMSQASERILGWPPSHYLGQSGYGSVHPDDVSIAAEAMAQLLSGQIPEFHVELRLATAQATWLWCEVRGRLMDWLEDGRPKVVTIDHGIEERREALLALQESELALRTIFDQTPVLVAMTNNQGRYLAVNGVFEQISGRGADDVLGRTSTELGLIDSALDDEVRHRIRSEGQIEQMPLAIRRLDGSLTHGLLSARQIAPGGQARVLLVWQDLSARIEAERALEGAVQRLEESNAELERFTYTVSHDLKSPLITITGFAEMLWADAAAGRLDRLDHSAERIQSAARRMMQLLDELLELSRVGRIANPPEACALNGLVAEAVELVAGQISERAIAVTVQEAMPAVFGDRPRLREALQNLLDNACKFSRDEAKPAVAVGAELDAATGQVRLYVRDNGVGFDPAYRERIFGLFDQLDPQRGGTGIGLALVKRIVEHHGGRVWAESEGPGHGATFWLTLPAPPE